MLNINNNKAYKFALKQNQRNDNVSMPVNEKQFSLLLFCVANIKIFFKFY